jgi:hypothetical protein
MAFDRKAYQREYARNKYQSLSPEERRLRNSSEVLKRAKAKYRSNPLNRAKENAGNREWYQRNKAHKNAVSRLSRYRLSRSQYEVLL